MLPSGAAPTSPPEGVLRHMRHQELWRAVGTHYGQTQIYGPTGHAIGGTAQQALWSFYRSYRSQASALSVTTTGRQRPVGVWTSPPPPGPCDSQESTTGLRCSWRTRTGATPCDGTDDYATAGSGQTRQSGARDSELPQEPVDVACASLLV
jgi:hypothetical protein